MCNPITTDNPGALLSKGIRHGYEWEVTTNGLAVRCGYIRIPPGHPWHGKHYSEIHADAHGGVNFSEPDLHCGKGGKDDAWWLGFDCGHAYDARDPTLPGYRPEYDEIFSERNTPPGWPRMTIKSTAYVEAECWRLIDQAAAAARKGKRK